LRSALKHCSRALALARPTPQPPRPKRAHDRRVRVAVALCHRQPHPHVCTRAPWLGRPVATLGLLACPVPPGVTGPPWVSGPRGHCARPFRLCPSAKKNSLPLPFPFGETTPPLIEFTHEFGPATRQMARRTVVDPCQNHREPLPFGARTMASKKKAAANKKPAKNPAAQAIETVERWPATLACPPALPPGGNGSSLGICATGALRAPVLSLSLSQNSRLRLRLELPELFLANESIELFTGDGPNCCSNANGSCLRPSRKPHTSKPVLGETATLIRKPRNIVHSLDSCCP
jgi:hypothetical protein